MISWYELNNLQRRKEMPIGNGPDCYTGTNKEEDKAIKVLEIADEWWDSLTIEEKMHEYCDAKGIEY